MPPQTSWDPRTRIFRAKHQSRRIKRRRNREPRRPYRFTCTLARYLGDINLASASKKSSPAESPFGTATFVGGNISVAIISVIRPLIVPDRSSIREWATFLILFRPYLADGSTLTDPAGPGVPRVAAEREGGALGLGARSKDQHKRFNQSDNSP